MLWAELESWTAAYREGGIALLVLLFVGFCTVWIGLRLLGKDGLFTLLARRHCQFVDDSDKKLGESLEVQAKVCDVQLRQTQLTEKVHDSLERLIDQHDDVNSTFSTVHLHEAGVRACDVAKQVCTALNIDATSDLNKIQDELTAARQRYYEAEAMRPKKQV